jgi:hypothetical protein
MKMYNNITLRGGEMVNSFINYALLNKIKEYEKTLECKDFYPNCTEIEHFLIMTKWIKVYLKFLIKDNPQLDKKSLSDCIITLNKLTILRKKLVPFVKEYKNYIDILETKDVHKNNPMSKTPLMFENF